MSRGERLFFVDSGRAVASLLGIFFHSTLVFSAAWMVGVPPEQRAAGLRTLGLFLTHFRMPLFLFISGYFTRGSLVRHAAGDFTTRRLKRVALPLFCSMILLLPPQEWVIQQHTARGTSFNWDVLQPWAAGFNLQHLWFLYHILLYSFLFLAVRRWLESAALTRIVDKLHLHVSSTLAVWVAFNTAIAWLPTQVSTPPKAWLPLSAIGLNLPMFLFGYWLNGRPRQIEALLAPGRRSSILVFLGAVLLLAIPGPAELGPRLLLDVARRWSWTFVVLIALRNWANRPSALLRSMSDQSYPVYLFHHPIVVACGAAWVWWAPGTNPWLGYCVVVLASIGLTYGAVHWVVGRSRLGSWLFTGSVGR
jgi:glucan biosynthesis protein C